MKRIIIPTPTPIVSGAAVEPLDNLTVRTPPKVAGGWAAIQSTFRVSLREMGLWRTLKALRSVNQKRGFDCQGCAWPDPEGHRSLTEFCENGAKAVAFEATQKQIGHDFFSRWSIAQLSTQTDHWLEEQGRLTEPLWLPAKATHYQPISWNELFQRISVELGHLESPHEAVFYTSGRTSNEAAFLYQLLVRCFGTNNLPDCSNLCHESSGVALTESIGSGKGTVSLDDFQKADLIFVIGQNPGTNHPRMLTTLQAAVRRGARIISINPLAETGLKRFNHPQEFWRLLGPGTPLASDFLQIRINGDVAAFKGIAKALLEEELRKPGTVVDRKFIDEKTVGFEEYSIAIRSEQWNAIESSSGVSKKSLENIAHIVMRSPNIICCWAMGLTQHQNAVANIQEVINFLLLTGNIGRPGAGACPVRGHSNVQGDRTMGILERPSSGFLGALETEFHFLPPSEPGMNVIESISAMATGRAKIFFGLGGNFLRAAPDTELVERGLRQCRVTAHVSTKLNRSHLVTGQQAFILPCLGRTEIDSQSGIDQFVSVEDSMGVVHASRGVFPPASRHLLSETSIVCRLAEATLNDDCKVKWSELEDNYDRIRDHIERVVPGFDNFNKRIRTAGGFVLPHPVRDQQKFPTPTGKAHFFVHPLPQWKLQQDEFLMMTVRSHDQFNTTVYALDDRYRGIFGGRDVVLMNPTDIVSQGLKDGQRVDLCSRFQGTARQVHGFRIIPYPIPHGCVATYFPETNPLVPIDSFADRSFTPASKSVVIRITPSVTSATTKSS